MNLQLIGLNHKTSSVAQRERAKALLQVFPGVLLATCNRVEKYMLSDDPDFSISREKFYNKKNRKAVLHLFRVAAGLDSQILGETEILGQVRDVYSANKGKSRFFDNLFKTAYGAGKKVREQTEISRGKISVASVAVHKAKKLLNGVKNPKIILIGSGKLAKTVLKNLFKNDFDLVWVANRTFNKAQELAMRIGGKAVQFDSLSQELFDADLVISSTGAPHYVLNGKKINNRKKPLSIIDLAVPRDVDPAVANLPEVALFNIDEIKDEINFGLAKRRIAAVSAERMIKEEVDKFCENCGLEVAGAS